MHTHNQAIFKHIAKRIDRNANCLLLVVGDTGSGKSYFALDFALKWAQFRNLQFDIGWVEFEARPVIDLLHSQLEGEHQRQPGQPLIMDEMGLAMSSRTFRSKENIGLSKTLQSVRFMNNLILFTVPQLSFVDVHARRLFHYIAMVKPKFRNNQNRVQFRVIRENRRDPNSPYFRRIPYKLISENEKKFATYFVSDIPPKKLRDDYEKKRIHYIKGFLEKTKESIESVETISIAPPTPSKYCGSCGTFNDGESTSCSKCGVML